MAVNAFLNDYLALNVVGFLDDEQPLGKAVFNRVKVLGRVSELQEIVKVFDVDEIICCLENVDHIAVHQRAGGRPSASREREDLVAALRRHLRTAGRREIREDPGRRDLPGRSRAVVRAVQARVRLLWCRRLVCCCWLPILAAIAVAIKLESPGPIVFRQTRVGGTERPSNSTSSAP